MSDYFKKYLKYKQKYLGLDGSSKSVLDKKGGGEGKVLEDIDVRREINEEKNINKNIERLHNENDTNFDLLKKEIEEINKFKNDSTQMPNNFEDIEKAVINFYKDNEKLIELQKLISDQEQLQKTQQEMISVSQQLKSLVAVQKQLPKNPQEIIFVTQQLETLISKQKELETLISKQKEVETLISKQQELETLISKQKEIISDTQQLETLILKQKELEIHISKQKELKTLISKQEELDTLILKQKDLKSLVAIQKTNISRQETKINPNILNSDPNIMKFMTLLKKIIILKDTIKKNNIDIHNNAVLVGLIPKYIKVSTYDFTTLLDVFDKHRDNYYYLIAERHIKKLGSIKSLFHTLEHYSGKDRVSSIEVGFDLIRDLHNDIVPFTFNIRGDRNNLYYNNLYYRVEYTQPSK